MFYSNYNSVHAAAIERRADAYSKLDRDYWRDKSGLKYRFDTFAQWMQKRADMVTDMCLERTRQDLNALISETNEAALYVGVPWCLQRCRYCVSAARTSPTVDYQREYFHHLFQEMDLVSEMGLGDKEIKSIYFGGGTPTATTPELLQQYIRDTLNFFPKHQNATITVESSIGCLTKRMLDVLAGTATRLSIGVQATDTELRRNMGRLSDRRQVLRTLELALRYVTSVNCDLIYGLPGQQLEIFYQSLVDLIQIGIPSITLYRLEIFSGTPIHAQATREPWSTIQEESANLYYFLARTILEQARYIERPIGWFIKAELLEVNAAEKWRGFMKSWKQCVPYIGFGMGAFSKTLSMWKQNESDYTQWASYIKQRQLPIKEAIRLSSDDKFLMLFVRCLRTAKCFEWDTISSEYTHDKSRLKSFFEKAIASGLMHEPNPGIYVLTEAGEAICGWIASDAVSLLEPTGPRLTEDAATSNASSK